MNEFKKFSNQNHINQIYKSMGAVEKERLELYRSTNFQEKQIKKVNYGMLILKWQILSEIPGTGKANKKINQAIKALSKIYVGQLVEEAKLVQNQEK